jgi:hypothetical protein
MQIPCNEELKNQYATFQTAEALPKIDSPSLLTMVHLLIVAVAVAL